jgi:hypothetical protein
MNDQELNETAMLLEAMELDIEEQLSAEDQILGEAGGLISWFKRMYTATDGSVTRDLEFEIQRGIKDEEHRKKLLAEIDQFIKEAEAAQKGGVVSDTFLAGAVGAWLRGKARSSGKIKEYIARLRSARAKLASAKITAKD